MVWTDGYFRVVTSPREKQAASVDAGAREIERGCESGRLSLAGRQMPKSAYRGGPDIRSKMEGRR